MDDPSLTRLHTFTKSGQQKLQKGVVSNFLYDKKILYRQIGDRRQLVVLSCYHPLVFQLAHASPLAGH